MPRKYSDEFKAKAVRLAEDLVELEGCSKWSAAVEIGEKLGIPAHTLNDWLKPNMASSDVEVGAGESTANELKRLRKEIKELRRANEILKTASAFSRRNSTVPPEDDRIHRCVSRSLRGRGYLSHIERDRMWVHHLSWLPSSENTRAVGEEFVGCAAHS